MESTWYWYDQCRIRDATDAAHSSAHKPGCTVRQPRLLSRLGSVVWLDESRAPANESYRPLRTYVRVIVMTRPSHHWAVRRSLGGCWRKGTEFPQGPLLPPRGPRARHCR